MRSLITLVSLVALSNTFSATVSGNITIKNKSGESVADSCDQAVVFMEPVSGDVKNFTPKEKATIVSKDRKLVPSILPILKGTEVQFPNEDVILHNVFSLSKTKKFDLGLYRKGPGKSVVFDKSGLVKAFCNIHSGMSASILVLDYPYFARTKKNCSFSVSNVPNNTYKVSVWYRYGKGASEELKVTKKFVTGLSFDITETKKRKKKHKNKHGKSYKKSY